jgi:hypothetical protein
VSSKQKRISSYFLPIFLFFFSDNKNLNKRSVIYHATEKMRARGSRVTFYFTSNNFFSLHFYFNDRPKKIFFRGKSVAIYQKKKKKKRQVGDKIFVWLFLFRRKSWPIKKMKFSVVELKERRDRVTIFNELLLQF